MKSLFSWIRFGGERDSRREISLKDTGGKGR